MIRITVGEDRAAPIETGGGMIVAVSRTRRMAARLGKVAGAWQRAAPARVEVIGGDGRVVEARIPDPVLMLRMVLAGCALWRWLRRE